MHTSVAAGVAAVAGRSAVGPDAEAAARAVVSDGRRLAGVIGRRQRRVAVAVQRQAGAHARARTVSVQHVAHVAVEPRQEHGRRRRQRRHAGPVRRRKTSNVDETVVRRVAERAAGT